MGIVLTGAGKMFSGGADIREFNTPKALAEPTLFSLIRAVEASTKAVVAALNGAVPAAAWSFRWGATFASPRPTRSVALPGGQARARFPARAAHSACRARSASSRRST